ncbi:MAG: TerC family protein [Pyrinomonadaceae bacterium]
MEFLFDPTVWLAFLTLSLLELVLGIDNIVFISILADKLPKQQQKKSRIVGLSFALIMRIALLATLYLIIHALKEPLFYLFGIGFSVKDLILLGGGLFLIGKATHEIHGSLEGAEGEKSSKQYSSFTAVIVQIVLIDLVFSLDSVITAVGMVDNIWIMIAAVIVAILAMMWFSTPIGNFVGNHPTVKMLALSFLLLIGFTLVAEGFHQKIPKGYIYGAMAFSVFVEILNLQLRKRGKPVELHDAYTEDVA